MGGIGQIRPVRRGAGIALALLLCMATAAAAQQTPAEAVPAPQSQQPGQPQTAPAAASAPVHNDGFLGAVGRWIGRSAVRVKSMWQTEREAPPGDAPKSSGLGLWSKANVVDGHQRCDMAANGAPDCSGAIEALCRGKGFSTGQSLEIQSAQKCSARVWFSGTQPAPGECRMESYVQRAVCR